MLLLLLLLLLLLFRFTDKLLPPSEAFMGLFEMYATEDNGDGEKKITRAGIKLLFRFMGEIVTDAMVSRWLQEEDKNGN